MANPADDVELIQGGFKVKSRNESAGDDLPKLFKVTYLSTHGADHTCLTEMQFLDANRQIMHARLQEMSSCYGCPVKCEDCSGEWGDASRQFDLVSNNNDASAWSCTGVGSFINGGVARDDKPHVIFSLERRPAKIVFASADVGDWAPKSWIMQEYERETARWETIAQVSDAAADFEQSFFAASSGTAENPAKFPIDYDKCGGVSDVPVDVINSVDPPALSASFNAVDGRALSFAGTFPFDSGNGMAVEGEFGTITVGGTAYNIKQLTFNFPSNHRSPDGNQAEGEMHIIMQKVGSMGIFDLAVVDILLQLKEESAVDDATQAFFLGLGLEELPRQGEPKFINGSVDMTPFLPLFQAGQVQEEKCSEYVPWYILGQPAYITGTIQQAFLDGPSSPTPAPTFFNQTLVNMTAEQRIAAYAKIGLNEDGTPLDAPKSAEEQAVINAGPSAAYAEEKAAQE